MLALLSLLPFLAAPALAQVTASFPNGPTNPDTPEFAPIGSYVNQTSDSRLISLNSVDDFCIWGPPDSSGGAENLIGNVEPVVVAYCTKPRNGARLIPDGAITGAHFIKTDSYVQVWGFWDGTKVGIPYGDDGGELDPHGAENLGNPIGGNATSNVDGTDVFYEEWMSFISYDQFCLRVCTAETGNVTAALQCEHELDIMGCAFVMAIENFYQTNNTFSSCDGAVAAPPGLYSQANGSTSTFRQRYTGTWTGDAGETGRFTVGQTVTPSAPAFYPATSNCVTYSTISNGIDTANFQVTAAPQLLVSGSTSEATGIATTSQSAPTGISTSSPTSTSAASGSSATSGGASATGANSGSGSGAGAGSSTGSGTGAAASSGATSGAGRVLGEGVVMAGVVGVVGMLMGAATLL